MAGTAASAAELRLVGWAAPIAGVGFGLVLLAIIVADVSAPVRLALLAAFAVASVKTSRELRRAARGRVVAWDGQGGWTLDGEAVAVAPATRVHPGLVVLVLRQLPRRGDAPADAERSRTPLGRASVHWLPRSAAAPDAFRRLKQQLRHGRAASAPERPENTPC